MDFSQKSYLGNQMCAHRQHYVAVNCQSDQCASSDLLINSAGELLWAADVPPLQSTMAILVLSASVPP